MEIPFNFVIDQLFPIQIRIKPMFGMFAIYVGDKLVLILRKRDKNPENNGVWIATNKNHHQSLIQDFPILKSITGIMGKIDETKWQLLSSTDEDFEENVIKACELIKKNDPRIGKSIL
ncbi:hypothetical protein FA048_14955 [Pedobacter polaris]|uniref:TfoX N-terminal domain-containing protein n=1 Tax=Pedobacter polaris TaxID=2571273 RepID=A0A4U1CGX5_9SPHI|nr:hypothetical protein [Pedobacter polaris]TKC06511.1 hypothetical protein FA048_14955 [Pedobacter polaris]